MFDQFNSQLFVFALYMYNNVGIIIQFRLIQQNSLLFRNNVPPRPAGQRSEPETNVGFSGFGFGDGSYMSFGIGTFPFAFFTSTFNFGETRPSPGNILPPNVNRNTF